MNELIIAIISAAAGIVGTHLIHRNVRQREDEARKPFLNERYDLKRECDDLRQRNRALDSVITERRVKDAYQEGRQSRESEIAALVLDKDTLIQEVGALREQVQMEAVLDERARGRGYTATGKVVNIWDGARDGRS